MLKFKESFGSISVQTQSTYYTYFCYRHYTTCFSKHRPSYNNFNTISYISTYCYMPVILNVSSWYKRFWCNCYKYIKKDQISNTNPQIHSLKPQNPTHEMTADFENVKPSGNYCCTIRLCIRKCRTCKSRISTRPCAKHYSPNLWANEPCLQCHRFNNAVNICSRAILARVHFRV